MNKVDALAGAVMAIGTIVAIGWLCNIPLLTMLGPDLPAMVINTALSFILCSTSLLVFFRGQKHISSFCATLVFFVGFLSFAQYVFHTSFGLDEFLIRDTIRIAAPYPGRMTMATALAFMLQSTALLMLPHIRSSVRASIIAEICAVGGLIMGVVHVFGFLSGLTIRIGALAWESMALHTAGCFLLLGLCLLLKIWEQRPQEYCRIYPGIAPALATFAITFDVFTPSGVSSGIAYMPLIFCAVWYYHPYTAFIFAIIGTVLATIGFFFSTGMVTEFWVAIINRYASITAIWILATAIYFIKRREIIIASGEQRLDAILNNTVDGLLTIDEQGLIRRYNKACEKIFGYTAAEVSGKNIKILMPEPYRHEHDAYLQNYQKTGEKKIIGIGREVEGQRKNGTVFPIDLSVSEVMVEGKRLYSGIVRDITLRKQAEEEIIRSNTELERFAYIASHDLQEPLRMVANFTRLLSEEYKEKFDEQAQEYMQFIIEASRRMQNMVSDLLEYSRIGSEDAGFSSIDSQAHVQIALDNLKESILQTQAKIVVADLPVIEVNPLRFVRLIQNLIGNGIKYRSKDRVPNIQVAAQDRGREWLFSVRDNGIGINEKYLEQIFIIFKRLHGKHEYQGTGIGLAICKKIVESLGGRIWAESEYGQGSTFYFTIPKHIQEKSYDRESATNYHSADRRQ
ncbi:MAG: PAS domain S-box protein [Alphaproteobacteria bacterium]|nr:PAS domain S-box protein [Alphaproteobacteria bacterium]